MPSPLPLPRDSLSLCLLIPRLVILSTRLKVIAPAQGMETQTRQAGFSWYPPLRPAWPPSTSIKVAPRELAERARLAFAGEQRSSTVSCEARGGGEGRLAGGEVGGRGTPCGVGGLPELGSGPDGEEVKEAASDFSLLFLFLRFFAGSSSPTFPPAPNLRSSEGSTLRPVRRRRRMPRLCVCLYGRAERGEKEATNWANSRAGLVSLLRGVCVCVGGQFC